MNEDYLSENEIRYVGGPLAGYATKIRRPYVDVIDTLPTGIFEQLNDVTVHKAQLPLFRYYLLEVGFRLPNSSKVDWDDDVIQVYVADDRVGREYVQSALKYAGVRRYVEA